MLEYELVSYAMNSEKVDFLANMGKIVADTDVAKCSALKNLTDESLSRQQQIPKNIYKQTADVGQKIRGVQHVLDQTDDLGLNFLAKVPPAAIWTCASEQITLAERPTAQP